MFYFSLDEILTATMILFAIIDIIGSVPVILDLRRKVGHINSLKASVVSLALMIAFLFLGESMLSVIGVSVSSFAVAGSFVLFFIALEMILGIQLYRHEQPATASLVPLAFPLIVGPGTMTSLLSLKAEFHTTSILIAILLNVLLVFLVLNTSKRIEKALGVNGISVIQRIFGVVLLAIAVKLFATNVTGLLD